jgi:hypothetical protein
MMVTGTYVMARRALFVRCLLFHVMLFLGKKVSCLKFGLTIALGLGLSDLSFHSPLSFTGVPPPNLTDLQ